MAKELTARELYLQDHVPEITKKSDPFDSEINPLYKQHDKLQRQLEETKEKHDTLTVVREPTQPEPNAGNAARWTFGITVVIAALLFVFHCIVWVLKLVFTISWNTWGWTVNTLIYGGIISLIITAITWYFDGKAQKQYEEDLDAYKDYVKTKTSLEQIYNNLSQSQEQVENSIVSLCNQRDEVLAFAIRTCLTIPFATVVFQDYKDYDKVKQAYLKLLAEQDMVEQQTDPKRQMAERKKLMDAKLQFLYVYSLGENLSPEVYKEFNALYKKRNSNPMILRQDLPKATSRGWREIFSAKTYKATIERLSISNAIDGFQQVCQRDTKMLLFLDSSDKKTQQTKDMQQFVLKAKEGYDTMADINKKVAYALDFARGCAFRNIYLGAELVNYVKSKRKGGGLTKNSDMVEMGTVSNDGMSIDTLSLNESVGGAALGTVMSMADTVLNNKDMMQLVKNNPKMAAGIAAVAAITSGVVTYFKNMSANAEAQKQLADSMRDIATGFEAGKAGILRSVEIIAAIVKANQGFMRIYEPLRKRVFDEGDLNVTDKDLMILSKATKEYTNISHSKIK